MPLVLWGQRFDVYANANLSVYSAQECNALCGFCVEKLRPASRGRTLAAQRDVEADDERYFRALDEVLSAVRPLDPSVSITGGEATKDPRLPRLLRTLEAHRARKRTLTTNGSGLLDVREGREVIDWITSLGVRHLNISRAHPEPRVNARLMRLPGQLSLEALREGVRRCRAGGTRVRLSCVLLRDGIGDLGGVLDYLEFARSLEVDNVVFRQLMKTDASTHAACDVVEYNDRQRVAVEPLLDLVSSSGRFEFVRQILGYYYYVEVWRCRGVDVVFEEADLAQLERAKRTSQRTIHELVFHPNGKLASTWQPWDGVLGPPDFAARYGLKRPASTGPNVTDVTVVDPVSVPDAKLCSRNGKSTPSTVRKSS